jgi:hypothetical protein
MSRASTTVAPVDEVRDKTEIEKAVYDARYSFQAILGETQRRRTSSLYQLRGTEINRARYSLERALHDEQIRWGDVPSIYIERLIYAAEMAQTSLEKVKHTSTNDERLTNVLASLEDIIEYCNQAMANAAAVKAGEEAEKIARWPENKERGGEARRWGEILAYALDIMENISGESPERATQLDGWWELTPSSLSTELVDLQEDHPEIDLSEAVAALDEQNFWGAWKTMYDFIQNRKNGEEG